MGIWLLLCPKGSLSCSLRERSNTSTPFAPWQKAASSEKAVAGSQCLGSEPQPQAMRKPTPMLLPILLCQASGKAIKENWVLVLGNGHSTFRTTFCPEKMVQIYCTFFCSLLPWNMTLPACWTFQPFSVFNNTLTKHNLVTTSQMYSEITQ